MNFLMNDLSIHGQFSSASEFISSVDTLMGIRHAIRRAGRELFCHRGLKEAQVTAELTMPEAIQAMSPEKRRAWTQWLSRLGPYWMDDRQHGDDEWLEAGDGRIVTDSAVGESAFCRVHGLLRETVSINPSAWLLNPIPVTWRKTDGTEVIVDVPNHWSLDTVATTLENLPSPFDSWASLEQHARRTCDRLTFAQHAFVPLEGQPYAHGAAERIQIRLNILNKMCGCFDSEDNRTREGNRLYTEHFTGEKAWFTDSSVSEKADFRSELTFPHPHKPGEYLFCTWHGKIKSPQLRIHFSWPIAANLPLYIVYVGPKLTKR